MHTFFSYLLWTCVSFCSLSLFDRLRYGAQIAQIHSGSKTSSWHSFENFQARGVHSERQVILSNFSDITLPDVIQTWGWESLCVKPVRCPIMFVQQFYFNLHDIDTNVRWFATRFRGTRIVVTPDLVAEVLCDPKVSHPDHPSCDRLQTVSWDMFISHFYETPSI